MKLSGKVGSGLMNKRLNFGGDPHHRPDTGIVFRIRHYWEIRKVVNGHSFILIRQMAAMVRRKTCLGGGMHCPGASSLLCWRAITTCRRSERETRHRASTSMYSLTFRVRVMLP